MRLGGRITDPNRLPISYELGDRLYGLLHHSRLVQDEGDTEGEVAEDAVEEEII